MIGQILSQERKLRPSWVRGKFTSCTCSGQPLWKAFKSRYVSRPAETVEGNCRTVALLTGGFDKPYAVGLATALAGKGLKLDVIGSDDIDCRDLRSTEGIRFLNFQTDWRPNIGFARKLSRVLKFYATLLRYASGDSPKVFHILWNGKLTHFDRTVLMLLYKLWGKRIAYTAHNVNTARRDGTDTWLNRATLRAQYRLVDRVFVHTDPMREELCAEYGVAPESVCVIPFGINNAVPHTALQPEAAKRKLGLRERERTLLFFGRIQPYKGLDCLIGALEHLQCHDSREYWLIIAGEPKREYTGYWATIKARIESGPLRDRVLQRIQFVSDEETEVYFKAADALVLPYSGIYQSGVLFLGFSFGLPVIATDVGTFGEEVVTGETGFLCRPHDPVDLARAIQEYFASGLYRELARKRLEIQAKTRKSNSWDVVAEKTIEVYQQLSSRV